MRTINWRSDARRSRQPTFRRASIYSGYASPLSLRSILPYPLLTESDRRRSRRSFDTWDEGRKEKQMKLIGKPADPSISNTNRNSPIFCLLSRYLIFGECILKQLNIRKMRSAFRSASLNAYSTKIAFLLQGEGKLYLR